MPQELYFDYEHYSMFNTKQSACFDHDPVPVGRNTNAGYRNLLAGLQADQDSISAQAKEHYKAALQAGKDVVTKNNQSAEKLKQAFGITGEEETPKQAPYQPKPQLLDSLKKLPGEPIKSPANPLGPANPDNPALSWDFLHGGGWDYELNLIPTPLYLTPPGIDSGPWPDEDHMSVPEMWKELHRKFNDSFPVDGAPDNFPGLHETLPLNPKLFGFHPASLIGKDFHVIVTNVQYDGKEIYIRFASLVTENDDHIDGANSSIEFRITADANGVPHLNVKAHVDGGPTTVPGAGKEVQMLYQGAAIPNWQNFINKLASNTIRHR